MAITPDEARFYIASVRTFLIWNTSGQAHASGLGPIIEKARTGLPQGPQTVIDMWAELIKSSVASRPIRQIFAASGMFEFVLKFERAGALDRFMGARGLFINGEFELSPEGGVPFPLSMRLGMLREIYDAREGGFLTDDDPTGVVTWISGVKPGLDAMTDELVNDHSGNLTRGVTCQIIADLTIPEAWAKGVPSSIPMASPTPSPLLGAVDGFRAELASIDLPAAARADLARQADRAKARLITIAGGAQSAQSGPGPGTSFADLPDGSKVAIAPGKPVPWYQRPRFWVAGVIGTVAGLTLAAKRS